MLTNGRPRTVVLTDVQQLVMACFQQEEARAGGTQEGISLGIPSAYLLKTSEKEDEQLRTSSLQLGDSERVMWSGAKMTRTNWMTHTITQMCIVPPAFLLKPAFSYTGVPLSSKMCRLLDFPSPPLPFRAPPGCLLSLKRAMAASRIPPAASPKFLLLETDCDPQELLTKNGVSNVLECVVFYI